MYFWYAPIEYIKFKVLNDMVCYGRTHEIPSCKFNLLMNIRATWKNILKCHLNLICSWTSGSRVSWKKTLTSHLNLICSLNIRVSWKSILRRHYQSSQTNQDFYYSCSLNCLNEIAFLLSLVHLSKQTNPRVPRFSSPFTTFGNSGYIAKGMVEFF